MAQVLAPYNNSMRLGQGFNSYTQQICLDKAVLRIQDAQSKQKRETLVIGGGSTGVTNPSGDPQSSGSSYGVRAIDGGSQEEQTDDEEQQADLDDLQQRIAIRQSLTEKQRAEEAKRTSAVDTIVIHPWVKPQIVTYSSSFVDKISDVTDAMNISGSLSIKTATIGGKANGSYVDSDKFKSSDINFHLRVSVTNQIHDATDYSWFNKLEKVPKEKFTEVYGDCFISGWEEGGELNAVISVKVLDKSKIFQVKAGLEAELTTPGISGAVQANVEIEKSNLAKSTETTITVNWSGGGSIKNPGEPWTIDTLKKAAAAFPEYVAITPQRTFAILTKYTALESFHLQYPDVSPLDYENAGIYTGALLDSFMDYKALWKQINHSIWELEAGRATIEMCEVTEEMATLAVVHPTPQESSRVKSISDETADVKRAREAYDALIARRDPTQHGTTDADNFTKYPPFSPSFAGLIRARKICRSEMAKIVREVDVIAKFPELATDMRRDLFFLHPLVFKQLLPIVRSQSPENAKLGVYDATATLLLGYVKPKIEDKAVAPVYIFPNNISTYSHKIQQGVEKVKHKAGHYRMEGCVGPVVDKDEYLSPEAIFFNDLQELDALHRPSDLFIWATDNKVTGVQVQYTNGVTKSHGVCEGVTPHKLFLDRDGSEVIVEVLIRQAVFPSTKAAPYISSIAVSTSIYNVLDTRVTTTSTAPQVQIESTTYVRTDDSRYSFRGFFGFEDKGNIGTLGIVWGKDGFVPVPAAQISKPLCRNFLDLSVALRDNVKSKPRNYTNSFFMGGSLKCQTEPANTEVFNSLDEINANWTIRKISFFCSTPFNALCGLKVKYAHGRELNHGNVNPQNLVWSYEVDSDLAIVKITAGKRPGDGWSWIDSLEFVKADDARANQAEDILPAWPLDLGTVRFMGKGETRVNTDVRNFIERAPNAKFTNGVAKWSIKGFYGDYDKVNDKFGRLGIVWGQE